MKLGTAREDIFIVFLSFWGTILATRYWSFEYFKVFHHYPVLRLGNVPVHHFLIGLLLVSSVLTARLLTNRFSLLNLFFLGIGIGLVTDEFWLIATGNFTTDNAYWAGQNLTAIIFLGVLSFVVVKLMGRKHDNFLPIHNHPFHENPKDPLVTVVVPALNEEDFLSKNLQSIVTQNFKNFELIVVDNNSTDRTAVIARAYGAKVIFNQVKGVGAARQAGFMEARGKIIATTDADNILPPDWLTRIVKEFDKDQKLVAFGGLFRLYSGPLSARIAVRYLTYPTFQFDKLITGNWSLIAQNMAVRRSASIKVGGLKSIQIGEDADLSHRLANIGRVIIDPVTLVYPTGRRARHGLWYGIWSYAPNGITRMFFKKHKFDKLPTIRQEHSPLAKLSFIPLLASVIYLIILFSSMNSTIASAKQELLSRTTASISKIKLKQIAGELSPVSSWSAFFENRPVFHFFQEN